MKRERHRGDGERTGRFVEDELQPADMTAVQAMRPMYLAVVANLCLARGALPGHGDRIEASVNLWRNESMRG